MARIERERAETLAAEHLPNPGFFQLESNRPSGLPSRAEQARTQRRGRRLLVGVPGSAGAFVRPARDPERGARRGWPVACQFEHAIERRDAAPNAIERRRAPFVRSHEMASRDFSQPPESRTSWFRSGPWSSQCRRQRGSSRQWPGARQRGVRSPPHWRRSRRAGGSAQLSVRGRAAPPAGGRRRASAVRAPRRGSAASARRRASRRRCRASLASRALAAPCRRWRRPLPRHPHVAARCDSEAAHPRPTRTR